MALLRLSKKMGYGDGKNAIARWREEEVEVMNAICRAHGIEPLTPEKSRGTLEVAEYKEQRHKADELAEENARVEAEIAEKKQDEIRYSITCLMWRKRADWNLSLTIFVTSLMD